MVNCSGNERYSPNKQNKLLFVHENAILMLNDEDIIDNYELYIANNKNQVDLIISWKHKMVPSTTRMSSNSKNFRPYTTRITQKISWPRPWYYAHRFKIYYEVGYICIWFFVISTGLSLQANFTNIAKNLSKNQETEGLIVKRTKKLKWNSDPQNEEWHFKSWQNHPSG